MEDDTFKIDRKKVTHVSAVLRCDRFLRDESDYWTSVSVKEIRPTLEIAQAEVDRLNTLSKELGVDCLASKLKDGTCKPS